MNWWQAKTAMASGHYMTTRRYEHTIGMAWGIEDGRLFTVSLTGKSQGRRIFQDVDDTWSPIAGTGWYRLRYEPSRRKYTRRESCPECGKRVKSLAQHYRYCAAAITKAKELEGK